MLKRKWISPHTSIKIVHSALLASSKNSHPFIDSFVSRHPSFINCCFFFFLFIRGVWNHLFPMGDCVASRCRLLPDWRLVSGGKCVCIYRIRKLYSSSDRRHNIPWTRLHKQRHSFNMLNQTYQNFVYFTCYYRNNNNNNKMNTENVGLLFCLTKREKSTMHKHIDWMSVGSKQQQS